MTDYYAFGAPQPGRNFNAPNYRYGMNGQENDNEITGNVGTHTSAEYWEYDTRLGRRWNRDPKPIGGVSDYACFTNNPILFSDPNGDIIKYVGSFFTKLRLKAHDFLLRTLSPSAKANYSVLKESPLTHYRRAAGDKTLINGIDHTDTDYLGSSVEPTDKENKFSGTVITTDFSQKTTNTHRPILSRLLTSAHEWSHAYDYALGTRDDSYREDDGSFLTYNEAKSVHAENVSAAEINRFLIRNLSYRFSYRMAGQYQGGDTYQVPVLVRENQASIVTKYYDTYYTLHRFKKGLSTKDANTFKDPRTPVYFWDPLKKYGGKPKK
jgi:RHS repeat-associated protein